MKNLLIMLLLLSSIICNVACTRRAPRQSGLGRQGNQQSNVTRPKPNGSSNTVPMNPVTPRSVDKAKPNVEQIKRDLVGHSFSEGVKDGYYPSNWRWTIKEGEISGFSIEQVMKDSSAEYEVVSNMRLTSCAGKSFNAKVRICYMFNESEGWHIQFVQSQGMQIIKTGNYDDCINAYVYRDAWSWTYCLENNCEIALEVCGLILESGTWNKFSKVIAPNSTEVVGRVVEDGRIDFVEIP